MPAWPAFIPVNPARYRRIVFFFARALAGLFAWEIILPRLGLRAWSARTRPARLRRLGARFRALAINMGGVMIKMGQFLSARLDVLPEEVTSELAGLQDEVPPEDFNRIRALAEAELGAPLGERYASFEIEPLAAASLGQAHRASLRQADGTLQRVVVKIQRPGIEVLVATDLAALRTVGSWLMRYPPIRRRADVPALLAEFTRILYEEIDYLAEGRNAEAFAANFERRPEVRVPRVAWTHTTRRVLTLEDVYGIKITDYAAITAAGLDRAQVARRLFESYLRQIFEDGFFHADPHPGNLFVEVTARPAAEDGTPEAEAAGGAGGWRLTFVDFGMVGRVPAGLRAGLREMAIAAGTQDAPRMVKATQMLGMLLPGADLDLLAKAEARAFERFGGRSMQELREMMGPKEMHAFAREFRELVYAMPFQVPEDMILLGRTVAILSGMCTGLDPDFNVWQGLAPFAQKLLADEAASGLDIWLDEAGKWLRTAVGLPVRLGAVLDRVERGELQVSMPELAARAGRLEAAVRRLAANVVFAALLLAGVQLVLAGRPAWGGALLAGSAAALAWGLLGR